MSQKLQEEFAGDMAEKGRLTAEGSTLQEVFNTPRGRLAWIQGAFGLSARTGQLMSDERKAAKILARDSLPEEMGQEMKDMGLAPGCSI